MFADLVRTRAALLGSNVACNDDATNKKERNGRAPSPVARESRTQARVEAVPTRRHVLNFPRPWCWFCGLGKARSQSGVDSSAVLRLATSDWLVTKVGTHSARCCPSLAMGSPELWNNGRNRSSSRNPVRQICQKSRIRNPCNPVP